MKLDILDNIKEGTEVMLTLDIPTGHMGLAHQTGIASGAVYGSHVIWNGEFMERNIFIKSEGSEAFKPLSVVIKLKEDNASLNMIVTEQEGRPLTMQMLRSMNNIYKKELDDCEVCFYCDKDCAERYGVNAMLDSIKPLLTSGKSSDGRWHWHEN